MWIPAHFWWYPLAMAAAVTGPGIMTPVTEMATTVPRKTGRLPVKVTAALPLFPP